MVQQRRRADQHGEVERAKMAYAREIPAQVQWRAVLGHVTSCACDVVGVLADCSFCLFVLFDAGCLTDTLLDNCTGPLRTPPFPAHNHLAFT
jgi:hypothetical protein